MVCITSKNGYGNILLTAFPNTCSLTSHNMSFAMWLPIFDCVSTPSVVRLWHGTPGPPLLVICVKLKMMSKMSSISIFTARTIMWFLFAGDLRPYSQRQECRTYLPFCTRTTTNSIFSNMNWLLSISRLAVERIEKKRKEKKRLRW